MDRGIIHKKDGSQRMIAGIDHITPETDHSMFLLSKFYKTPTWLLGLGFYNLN
jgi:hypothetical protein